MVEAGRKFLGEMNNILSLEIKTNEEEFTVYFAVEYKIGSPWTLILKDSYYGEISLDFGNYYTYLPTCTSASSNKCLTFCFSSSRHPH